MTAIASTAPLTNLVFDQERKDYLAKPGDAVGTFVFQVTNVTDVAVHIIGINASCGCTRAEMPRIPWVIWPHTHEELHATMNIAGRPAGDNTKYLTIVSTNGSKQLWVRSFIPSPVTTMSDREKNQLIARTDRQAVFKNDCAECHVEKSRGLMGAALYKEACGICHDSDHRATIVPELGSLAHPTDATFWRLIISEGKENTLMPAFSQAHGGPLTGEQIESLVAYFTNEFPKVHKPVPQMPNPPPTGMRGQPATHSEIK